MESWIGRYVQQQSSLIKDFGFVVEDFGGEVKVYWRDIGTGDAEERVVEKVNLTVSDSGCGFKLEKGTMDGMGLRIMEYRSELVGATLRVKSASGKGTTVACKLKLNR